MVKLWKYAHANEIIESNSHPSSAPSPHISAFNNGTKVMRDDLRIDDVVCINTTIDSRDIADPNSDK